MKTWSTLILAGLCIYPTFFSRLLICQKQHWTYVTTSDDLHQDLPSILKFVRGIKWSFTLLWQNFIDNNSSTTEKIEHQELFSTSKQEQTRIQISDISMIKKKKRQQRQSLALFHCWRIDVARSTTLDRSKHRLEQPLIQTFNIIYGIPQILFMTNLAVALLNAIFEESYLCSKMPLNLSEASLYSMTPKV